MIDRILNFFFPPRCPFCRNVISAGIPYCNDCGKLLPFITEKSCSICGRPLSEYSHDMCAVCHSTKTYFEHAFIPLVYKDSAKEAAIALKASHPHYARAFAYLMTDKILSSPYYTDFDCITFIPESPRAGKKRGYNQAELIAKEIGKLLRLPCRATLIRTDDGARQHTLNAAQRRENVKKCYFKTDAKAEGTVLLVDDIYTTGATTNYCSRLLKEMGFKKVYLTTALIRADE